MSENYELGRCLRRREKNANEAGAGRFEKPAPDARAAPLEAHESLISRKTVAEVPLTGLSFTAHAADRGILYADRWIRPGSSTTSISWRFSKTRPTRWTSDGWDMGLTTA